MAGAGEAAQRVMADRVAGGMAELGRVAVSLEMPASPGAGKPGAAVPGAGPGRPGGPWNGWKSGASGHEAADGSFAAYRGKELGIVGTWGDTTAEAQAALDSVDTYGGRNVDLDIAVGGLVKGESWEQAAAGAYADRWTTAMRNLRAKRAGKGITYVRIAHEMNGDWMPWSVNSGNVGAYKQAYRLYASIIRREFPEARITWSPNGGNHTDVSIDDMYPGGDVTDVIGPDIYDGYPNVTSDAVCKESTEKWASPESPHGLAAWRDYARQKGKPIALPEWGLAYGDYPEYIRCVNSIISASPAASGPGSNAGRFVYDIYFNSEEKFKLVNGPNPQSSAVYKTLSWGG
jgi:hypothetical protein